MIRPPPLSLRMDLIIFHLQITGTKNYMLSLKVDDVPSGIQTWQLVIPNKHKGFSGKIRYLTIYIYIYPHWYPHRYRTKSHQMTSFKFPLISPSMYFPFHIPFPWEIPLLISICGQVTAQRPVRRRPSSRWPGASWVLEPCSRGNRPSVRRSER